MTRWAPDELQAIAAGDDLHVAPFRPDGRPGTPTWIWSVVVDDELFVRACHGTGSSWFGSARETGAGLVRAAGADRAVSFVVVGASDHGLRARIDAAYRAKYDPSPYVARMVSDEAAAATVRVEPRTQHTPT